MDTGTAQYKTNVGIYVRMAQILQELVKAEYNVSKHVVMTMTPPRLYMHAVCHT